MSEFDDKWTQENECVVLQNLMSCFRDLPFPEMNSNGINIKKHTKRQNGPSYNCMNMQKAKT